MSLHKAVQSGKTKLREDKDTGSYVPTTCAGRQLKQWLVASTSEHISLLYVAERVTISHCRRSIYVHIHRQTYDYNYTLICTLCLRKKYTNFETIQLKIIRTDFDDVYAEIFKILQNRVCMFQFSCRFAFLSTFRLSNRTPKITRILTLYQANSRTLMRCIFYKTYT